MKEKSLYLFIISLCFCSIFVIGAVLAQEDDTAGLIASPPYISDTIGEGVKIEEDIRISNFRDTDEDIYIRSRQVAIDSEGNYYIPEDYDELDPSEFEENGWLTFEPKEFHLKKGANQMVHIEIDMPEDLPTQGFYLELAATTSDLSEDEVSVALAPEIVIPIAVNYIGEGEQIKELEIVSFKTSKTLYEYLPVEFLTHLSNKGNVHMIPVGQIFVSKNKEFNDNVASISFNDGKHRVLYNGGRKFTNEWEEGFLVKRDNKLEINWKEMGLFRFGKYYAQLNIAWEDNQGMKYISKETSFWVIPWKLLLILLLIILGLVLIIKGRKIYEKRKNRGINKYIEK